MKIIVFPGGAHSFAACLAIFVGPVAFAPISLAFEVGPIEKCTEIPRPGLSKLAALHGQLTWASAWPNNRYSGRLDINVFDTGFDVPHVRKKNGTVEGGSVWGTMIGEAISEVQSGGPCKLTHTPERHAARFAAEYSAARKTISLTVTQWLTEPGQYTLSCGPNRGPYPYGSGSPFTPAMLQELLGNLTVAADGSVDASKEWLVPHEGRMRATVSLQRGLQCGASPEGFVYVSDGVILTVRSGPSHDSRPVSSILEQQAKLFYTAKVISGGATWYNIQYRGKNGWVPQSETTCERKAPSNLYKYRLHIGYRPKFPTDVSSRDCRGVPALSSAGRG